ncbi:MAG: hypothetical protein HKN07_15105 [Acidimicrobiia bacterium]|nr:hypothetical protein [Acidimicrobiia bacterium]
MADRLHVEGWAPDYGSPLETDEDFTPPPGSVIDDAEVAGPWHPIDGHDDGVEVVVFVDGVRRVDAYLTVDRELGPVPGLCGSLAVGAVRWDRRVPRSTVTDVEVQRLAVFTNGLATDVPIAGPQLAYTTHAVHDPDPAVLIRHFHEQMRRAEARLAERLAAEGLFVVADGPINDLSATEKVGYIKTHRVTYLPAERAGIIARLGPGQRSPLFTIGQATSQFPKYSWYVRLAVLPNGHSWTGIVRCEASTKLGVAKAAVLANRTAALLPLVASEAHVDPRAPQNLVPISALEKEMRRYMGDPKFIHRALQAAVARSGALV